jgi:Flp pilus assembly protein TadG
MIRVFTRLWNDRRGNALMIAGFAMPLVVGAAGLATDTIQWALWTRELQRAADSAAFAGVFANIQANGSKTAAQAVDDDLAASKDNHTVVALRSGYPIVTYPTSPNWSYGVKVQLSIQQSLGFSSLFRSTAPIITVSATAAYVDQGDFCMGALKKSGGSGITVQGSSTTNLGCGAIANSTYNPSVDTNGGSYNFNAPIVAGAGNLPSSMNGVTKLEPYHAPIPDPFAGKYSTAVPSPCNGQINGNQTTFGPGCYKDFSFTGNKTYTLQPGVYYVNNTDFSVAGGNTVIGTGVTIILTGTSPGSVKITGNPSVQLTAPTDTASPYYKMLFIQASNAAVDNTNTFSGDTASYFDGAMYFPSGNITFSGSSANMTRCIMAIGYTVTISGNADFQNQLTHPDGTPCQADERQKIKEVKLVA